MTISEIAAQAGVSISTVSRVINNASNVAPATAKRVRDIIEKNGFVPYQNALALKQQKTNKILIMIPYLSNPFFSLVTSSLTNILSANNYTSLMGITDYMADQSQRLYAMLENHEVDGAILFFEGQSKEALEAVAKKYPCVCIGKALEHVQISSVSIDDTKAAYEATEYFIKQGHTKIAIIGGYGTIVAGKERGFQMALQDYGIPQPPEYLQRVEMRFRGGFDYDGGVVAAERLMSLPEPPTALLVSYDTHALGVAKYLLNTGIVPGKDIALIGYDNNPACRIYHPSISSISQPYFDIGSVAAKILLEQISTQDLSPRKIILPHELLLRDSSAYQK